MLPILGATTSTLVLAGVLARGSTPGADTVFWAPGATNGIQGADLPIVAVAALGVTACLAAALGGTTRARLVAAVATATLLTFLGMTLIKGDGPGSGRTVVTVTEGIGLNSGDIPVVAVWLVGIVACALLATMARHGSASDASSVRPPQPGAGRPGRQR